MKYEERETISNANVPSFLDLLFLLARIWKDTKYNVGSGVKARVFGKRNKSCLELSPF